MDLKPLFSVERGEKMVELLVDFPEKFTRNLDEIWLEHDIDNNSKLNIKQSFEYLTDISRNMVDSGWATKNLQNIQFSKLFNRFDEDNDLCFSKIEMSNAIKEIFKR